MADHVVLKRLTGKSDIGWFRSIFYNRGLPGRQKGIALNKQIINDIWPNLLVRQAAYEAAKKAEVAAMAPGGAGPALAATERAKAEEFGHLPIHVEICGPGGKPRLPAVTRLMALQAKNWRLNGDFIEDPPGEPNRFDPALQEGDLALIGFDGQEWPTGAVVVLLAQSTADAILMTDLSQMVKKGIGSMVKLPPDYLQSFADRHVLPDGHVIRTLAGDPVVAAALEEIAQGDLAAATKIRKRRPSRPITAEEHAAAIEAQRLTGLLGEKLVDAHLLTAHEDGGPAHRWMWPDSAAHPYDFELLDATNAVNTVIDAKSTAHGWPADFFMSSGELDYAANSSVPYRIYRLTEVGPQGAWLRLSGDIRPFAKAVVQTFIGAAPPGTRATTIAISSTSAGLTWSDPPVRLPPAPP